MKPWLPSILALAMSIVYALGAPLAGVAQTMPVLAPPACAAPPCTAPIASTQLPNLGQVKTEIKAYYTGSGYQTEVASVEADAQSYIDARAKVVKKPALVLDIDDTSVLTYDYEVKHDFSYDSITWNDAAVKGFPPVDATLALAKHAEAEGVAVIFVTGRRVDQLALTRDNLVKDGYPIDGLYLRPIDDHAPSVVPFKSSARAQIESQGYTILETIGDQWSDLLGGHAERAYKLPNPMYYLP